MAKKPEVPHANVVHYDRLVATIPELDRKGAANPYTSHNGNMFSYLHPSGRMALRLGPGAREDFLAKYDSKLFEAYGIVQKEYVTVPDDLLLNTDELKPYFEQSFEYVKSLNPKPTKKG